MREMEMGSSLKLLKLSRIRSDLIGLIELCFLLKGGTLRPSIRRLESGNYGFSCYELQIDNSYSRGLNLDWRIFNLKVGKELDCWSFNEVPRRKLQGLRNRKKRWNKISSLVNPRILTLDLLWLHLSQVASFSVKLSSLSFYLFLSDSFSKLFCTQWIKELVKRPPLPI